MPSSTPRGTHARPVAPSGAWRASRRSRSRSHSRRRRRSRSRSSRSRRSSRSASADPGGGVARRGATLLGEHPELSTCCSTVGSPTCPWPRPCPGSCSRRWAKVRGQCEGEGTQGGGGGNGGGGGEGSGGGGSGGVRVSARSGARTTTRCRPGLTFAPCRRSAPGSQLTRTWP